MSKWLCLAWLVLAAPTVLAQTGVSHQQSAVPFDQQSGAPGPPRPNDREREDTPSLPDEMRTKMEIERLNNEHKKLLDNAKELGTLSSDVEKAYKLSSKLGVDEYKKLASIEKLAKRILSDCGGMEVSGKNDSEDPGTIAEAVTRLNATAAGIEKKITAETRFVVSYEVITDSNTVIRLAQYLRKQKQAG